VIGDTNRVEVAIADRAWIDLFDRVAPFWLNTIPHRRHRLRGAVGEDGSVRRHAPKSTVLTARVTWAFASIYRHTGDRSALALAERAATELLERHVDSQHGGVYWSIDARRLPLRRHKHMYAQAFAIYAFTEMYLATRNLRWWDAARSLLSAVTTGLVDGRGGFIECADEEWVPVTGQCLGRADDETARVSTNTLIHIVEALANSVRADLGDDARQLLGDHLALLAEHALHVGGHGMHQWFDSRWRPLGDPTVTSPGHDLEAAWLLHDAAGLVNDPALHATWRDIGRGLVSGALSRGLDRDGGVLALVGTEQQRQALTWWAQAEGLAGFCWAAAQGDERAADAAQRLWLLIDTHFVSDGPGDWARALDDDRRRVPGGLAIGPWECPYHVVRTELGVLVRAGRLTPIG
jgi:mannobiose 2-epimerase